MAPVDEETSGEGMGFGHRDLRFGVLERALRDLEPAVRTDLQNEAITCSQIRVNDRIGRGGLK